MKKSVSIGMMLFCVCGCLAFSANAQELTIVTENFRPYNYEENGKVTGIATEIVQAVFDKMNLQTPIEVYPWARAYQMALEQPNVMIYSIVRSPEREKLLKWVGPLCPRVNMYLYKLKKRPDIQLNSLEDAKRYTMGVVRDSLPHQYFRQKGFEENRNLYLISTQDALIKNFFMERVDLIMSDDLQYAKQAKALGFSPDDMEQAFPLSELNIEFYMAFNLQTSDELVGKVNAAFEQIKAEGKIDAIIEKYKNSDN